MRRVRSFLLLATLCLGGCSLIVDFDRSRLVDAGVDGGLDAGIDRSAGADDETLVEHSELERD